MSTAVRLADVLAAVADGAGSTTEVARRTGASPEVADTALAALASAGRIRRVIVLPSGCAAAGCSSCGTARGCASAGVATLTGAGLTAWRVV